MTKKMIQYGERMIRNKTTSLVDNHSKLKIKTLENARGDDNNLRQLSKRKEEKRRNKQRLKTYKG